jgi:mono/diheme cytochrome c family protein
MVIYCRRLKNLFLAVSVFASLLLVSKNAAAQVDAKKLFKANCKSCHFLSDRNSTGPGLAGISTRRPDKDWLVSWIKNPAEFAKTNTDAKKALDLTPNAMTSFAGVLKDEEIVALADYILSEPGEEVVAKDKGAAPGDANAVSQEPKGIDPLYFVIISIIVLLIAISVMNTIRRNLQNAVNTANGKPEEEKLTFGQWCSRNKKIVALILIALTCYGTRAGWNALMGIGVYTDYKPEQPIKFSHQVHAGNLGIACEYCHSGVLKSKTASVPSVNVCMNCHKGVSEGPLTGTAEIQKIYDAAGFNTATMAYDKPKKAIEWVKVHNLPDFVYFNHQQHYVVGKQDCANCHGDMTKTDVAKQVAPLTMVWCVDCHRKTEVPGLKDNPYYEELHKNLSALYKGKKDSLLTVEKMGGLECGKCHY